MLPVKVTPIAAGQIEKAARWWLANRDKAPNAFKEEIERGFALLSQTPEVGAKATNVKLKDVRRIHLSRIRHFLYYRAMKDRVEVLACWHSSRLKGQHCLLAFESIEGPTLKEPPKPLQPSAQKTRRG